MKKIILITSLLTIIGLAFACGGSPPPNNPINNKTNNSNAPKQTAPVKADLGKKTFKQYCMICHGKDGKMGASGATNLATSTLTLAEKIEVIKKGRNTMTGFEMLGEEKINAVANYIHNFSENP